MIYFDNAATTKPIKKAMDKFDQINAEEYFNPSAPYSCAFKLSQEINSARRGIINYLHGDDVGDQVVFTSGATESNNLAIIGSAKDKHKKYLFSVGEHPAVYNTAMELKSKDYDVGFIPLRADGQIDYDKFETMLSSDVALVSVMFVNNETGAINDLKRVCEIMNSHCREALLHVDAVQGFGKIDINVRKCKINLLSMSAHKIGGIKGVGALYISKDTKIKNINFGGGQEFGLRSGTVNAGGILSFYEAVKEMFTHQKENYEKVVSLKEHLLKELYKELPQATIVSAKSNSPYVVSLFFKGYRGETIMRQLDSKGICVGTGSACSSSKVGNRVLENLGYDKSQIIGAIRVSFSPNNTTEEIDALITALKKFIK